MCTIIHNPRLRKPRKEEVTAYKVFDDARWEDTTYPVSYCGSTRFKFGWNRWSAKRAYREENEQSGFQLFAKLKDAKKYACRADLAIPVTILTKDIVKISDALGGKRVYEVKAFAIWKKEWDAKRKKEWDAGGWR